MTILTLEDEIVFLPYLPRIRNYDLKCNITSSFHQN